MKQKHFERYHTSNKEWVVTEESWDPSQQGVREAQFTLGNGLLGSRGIYEELPQDSQPGTFLAGFFDRTGSLVAELVNMPNPFRLWFALKGEKLGIVAMDFTAHRRELDLKHGLLFRQTTYRDTRKRKFLYESVRFLSMADRNLGVMQVNLTASEGAADLVVEAALDLSVWNSGTVTEGRKKHWRIREVAHKGGTEYVRIAGLDGGYSVAFATTVMIQQGGKRRVARDSHFHIRLKKGETVSLAKVFVIHSSGDLSAARLGESARSHLKAAVRRGIPQLTRDHVRGWQKLWGPAAITVKGAPDVQKALRFNTYHLLCSAPAPGSRGSIGAKTLSGEGYRGHIFWDSDIFLLPFYTHTHPWAAAEMLLYRYDRLNAAEQIATARGYRGAMYPWESAGTGEEETPSWAKGLNGSVIPIHTHEQEHHITADIAYAVHRYYVATGDDDFMLACGFEMLFKTARFWASRVEHNPRSDSYEIKQVIGPDEFHEDVDNNAYTNMMAKWNLLIARRMALHMKSEFPREFAALCRRIDLKSGEITSWKRIAPRLAMKVRKDGVIEQFDGYFKRRRIRLSNHNEYGLPELPKNFLWQDVGETQLVKQADVLMLLQLLSGIFGAHTKKANYQFYEPRTVHKSSLSVGTHAMIAADVGDLEAASSFFRDVLFIDLQNTMGNTAEGIHAASLGNAWQAAIAGFGGVYPSKGILQIRPRLPREWKELSFSYRWQGAELAITIEHDKVRLLARSARKRLPIRIYGHMRDIPAGKKVVFRK
jgi:kojibiose phosphorylase